MAESADAHDSGSCDSNIVRVQVPFLAPKYITYSKCKFFYNTARIVNMWFSQEKSAVPPYFSAKVEILNEPRP